MSAAFVLSNQRLSPEMTDYAWYCRSDGKGTFPSGDPAVTSGFVSNANRVVFGQFALGWSINRPGIGWVYFSAGPAQFGMTPEFTMCVTTETNIAAVNANDSRWTFRGRPSLNMRALIESQTKKP